MQQPARWAIDVGACPGGWTSYLADSCGYNVIAVDPAELHPDVLARPGVHHIKARAADAVQGMERLLQGVQVGKLLLLSIQCGTMCEQLHCMGSSKEPYSRRWHGLWRAFGCCCIVLQVRDCRCILQ
jgi:hypothetical protein